MAYNSAYTGPQVDGAVGSVIQNGEAWSGKQDPITGTQGQIVGFDNTGKPVAKNNTASDVTFSPGNTGMSANDVQAAVTELFTSVSDGKSAVAAAITDMGVTTAADATFQQMADNIGQIQTGPDTSDATATAGDILSGKTAYGASGKLTGTIPSQNAVTITPGTTQQTAIPAGTYAAGAATVEGDANLVPGNIAEGVSIFGVEGSYAGPTKKIFFSVANSTGNQLQVGYSFIRAPENTSDTVIQNINSGSTNGVSYVRSESAVTICVIGAGDITYTVNDLPASNYDGYANIGRGSDWSCDVFPVHDSRVQLVIQ